MTRIPADKRRAVEPYLKFIRLLDDDVELDTRVAHILDEFTPEDLSELAATLGDLGVRAGFSVPAIHLEEDDAMSSAVSRLADDGHEILLHGYRHTSFMDTSYETAHEELSRSLSIVEAETGATPTGLHVPYARASAGTIEAASDLGVEWVVGAEAEPESESEAGDGDDGGVHTLMSPIRPYDIQLLEAGNEPEAAFERVDENAAEDSLVLAHPNVHVHHGGAEAFAGWLGRRSVRPPGALAEGRGEGPGLLLDCFPPFQVV